MLNFSQNFGHHTATQISAKISVIDPQKKFYSNKNLRGEVPQFFFESIGRTKLSSQKKNYEKTIFRAHRLNQERTNDQK